MTCSMDTWARTTLVCPFSPQEKTALTQVIPVSTKTVGQEGQQKKVTKQFTHSKLERKVALRPSVPLA